MVYQITPYASGFLDTRKMLIRARYPVTALKKGLVMFEHEDLTRWECFQKKFWSRMFVWSCKLDSPYCWCIRIPVPRKLRDWFDKQYWKQLRKIPK